MFRRYPYWGWLIVSVLLWGINGYYFHVHRTNMQPEQMARTVTEHLSRSQKVFDEFVSDKDFIRRMFADSLTSQEIRNANSLPFYFLDIRLTL